MDRKKLPLAFTMGDAAGIGPEIILRLFANGMPHPAVVYGDIGILEQCSKNLGFDTKLQLVSKNKPAVATEKNQVIVLNRWQALDSVQIGAVNANAGQGAYEYLCHAIDDANDGLTRAIVTAPLNKAAMHAAGLDFPGHTEILAARTGTKNFAMMLANDELKVLLVTIHIALGKVAQTINIDSELQAIRLANMACKQSGIRNPRIAIAGLNPHAGEAGKFGTEETHIIQPAIELARKEQINVSDPLPGDTVFMRARKGEFDIVVAQYHDQGLIPIKYLGIDNGVNVTVGLPFVRTSVDHGTAYDIAGQGIADASSLKVAMSMALEMSSHS